MKIEFRKDRYHVDWVSHPETGLEALHWCNDTFGEGWGEFETIMIRNNDTADLCFSFHKLYHAQWFCLKYFDL